MCAVAPLTISGWQTVIATVLVVAITVGYGELRAHDTPHPPQGLHHPAPDRGGVGTDPDSADLTAHHQRASARHANSPTTAEAIYGTRP